MTRAFGHLAGIQTLGGQKQDAGAVGDAAFCLAGAQAGFENFDVFNGQDDLIGPSIRYRNTFVRPRRAFEGRARCGALGRSSQFPLVQSVQMVLRL